MAEPGTVVYVGQPIADRLSAGGFRLREWDATDELDGADCVVCSRSAGGLSAVRTVADRRPDLPIVYCTAEPDGTAASDATAAGATEYVPLSSGTLIERVRSLVDRRRAGETGTSGELDEAFSESGDSTAPGTADGGIDIAVPGPAVGTDGFAPELDGAPGRAAFDALFNQSTSLVGYLDAAGQLVRVNQPALEFVELPAAELLGRPFWTTPWWAGSNRSAAEVRELVERAIGGETVRIEATHETPDGEERFFDVLFQPVREDDDVVGSLVVGRDVTERVRATAAREASQEALERLYAITANTDLSFESKVDRLLALGTEYLGVGDAYLSSISDGTLEVVQAHNPTELLAPGTSLALDGTYCERAVEEEGLFGVPDVAASGLDGRVPDAVADVACYLGGRVVVDDELFGTLAFIDAAPRDRAFSASERTFVELTARWIGYEIEQQRTQRDLQDARERTERLLERIDDGFFALDDEGRFTYVNSRAEELLQRDADELVDRYVWEVFPEDATDGYYDLYRRAMEGQEPFSFEEHREGADRWMEVSVYPADDGLSVYFRDITDRKRHEEALNGLLTAGRELMAATTREEVARLVTDAATDILGYPLNGVWLVDADGERLEPVAMTDRLRETAGEGELFPVDGTAPSAAAFRDRTTVYHDDVRAVDDAHDRGAVRSALYLPLGDHGTLTIGSTAPDDIPETDRTLATILATTAETALDRADREESLRQYRAIHENVKEMVYVADERGRLQLVTPALAERVGRSRTWLRDRDVGSFIDEAAMERGRAAIEELLDAPAGESRTFETTIPTADGEPFPAEVEITLLPGDDYRGSIGVVRDLTALERARTELENERERFVALFEQTPDAVVDTVIRDGEPYVVSVNDAFEEVFGFAEAELRGESINEFIVPPEYEEESQRLDRNAPEGEAYFHEVERRTATGRRTFLFRGIPYAETDEGIRTFGIYTDVTERRDRERRLRVLHRLLRHNLRNDVTVMLGFADLLAGELDGEQAEWARKIHRTATKLSELGENVQRIERTFQRDSRGGPSAPLVDVVADAVADVRERYPAASLTTTVPGDVAVPGADLVRSAVIQLVENGVEHNDSGEPAVAVRAERNDGGRRRTVLLRVSDDGAGIPERERAVLSDETEITQLDHSRGLGLWLSRWVAESLGGDLRFEDGDGGGATVVLELPVARSD